MSEVTSNIEFAHKVHEQGHHHPSPSSRREKWIEIIEAIVLAVVAIGTAWSGYQAVRWEALSATHYALASRNSVRAQEGLTLAGQDRLYDLVTFNGWLVARASGNEKLVSLFERRFRPEYTASFIAWQKLDPFNNPAAPPGPSFMPEHKDAHIEESTKLTEQATMYFEMGVTTRESGDSYIKVIVFLATVLLVTALSQRFRASGPRASVVCIACILLAVSAYWILTPPRA